MTGISRIWGEIVAKINKIPVAKGIFWIDIEEADLRILCGCPADAVKHLMKRGLIIEKEMGGVVFETGPNAILLSESMLQNGEFCNLAEFPVLQILYKQGTIIPGHPNNRGEKPLLIGNAQQVQAQLQYIYRGNYGLVSKEEIMQAGIEEKMAGELMRMKLRFAFGKINASDEFLDTHVVKNEFGEIRNGVQIRRLHTNVFEIVYQQESIQVDLNLGKNDKYESTYPLGFHKIKREYFGVIHAGEGDGWDVNRPCMSSILMYQGKIYLIDAGPHLFFNLTSLGIGIDEIEGMFHTHAHDDHFAGITTLVRSGHKVKYFATPLVRATVEKKLAALLSIEERLFHDFFEVVDLQFDEWADIEGLEVMPIFSPHPLETNIFKFRTLWEDGYKSYAHFADIVSLDVLKGMVTSSIVDPGVSQEFFDNIKERYLEPVDLKKLDIGGGLIHGLAADFKNDPSHKILFSHLPRQLTLEEKEIGSCALHGVIDTLIPGRVDYARQRALIELKNQFPDAPYHQLQLLLNSGVNDINPGTIILKEGVQPATVQVILQGMVEKISSRNNTMSYLSAGAIIGELFGIHQKPADATFRASCFVKVLQIPVGLYMVFAKRNDIYAKIEKVDELRSFLQTCYLFEEGVSYPVLNKIANTINICRYAAGEIISCQDLSRLNVIKSGRVERWVGSEVVDSLVSRDYFGEERAAFNVSSLYRLEAVMDTEIYQIPGNMIKSVPIVRWKLFESYHRRTIRIVHGGNEQEVFIWREEFNVHVAEMDTHHKKIIEIVNGILEIIRSRKTGVSLKRAFASLLTYTRYHFSQEEALLERYAYPELQAHQILHGQLIQQINSFKDEILEKEEVNEISFKTFIEGWLVNHILTVDRQYAQFLNARGVF